MKLQPYKHIYSGFTLEVPFGSISTMKFNSPHFEWTIAFWFGNYFVNL